MSGFDSNPFVDPVDVNPFQVRRFCRCLRLDRVWETLSVNPRGDKLQHKPVWLVAGFGLSISWLRIVTIMKYDTLEASDEIFLIEIIC